jgi:hypothetical protein
MRVDSRSRYPIEVAPKSVRCSWSFMALAFSWGCAREGRQS